MLIFPFAQAARTWQMKWPHTPRRRECSQNESSPDPEFCSRALEDASCLLLWCSQRCGAEVHAEALAPDCHGPVLRQVQIIRYTVVLIADVTLERADFNEPGLLDRLAVVGVFCGHEVHMHVGPVGSFEV